MITLAMREDIEEIAALFQQAKAQMLRDNILQWHQAYPNLKHIAKDIIDQKCYKLVKNDEIVSVASFYQEGNTYWIKRFATTPSYTKCGYASQLYQHLENLGVVRQAEKICSVTNHSNQKMQHFFLKQGFHKDAEYEDASRKNCGKFYVFCKNLEVSKHDASSRTS